MRSPRINGGELRGQPANPVSPGKWPLKWSVCECGKINFSLTILWTRYIHSHSLTGLFNFSTFAVGMAGFPKSGLLLLLLLFLISPSVVKIPRVKSYRKIKN